MSKNQKAKKEKKDIGRIAGKIMAIILAAMMVLSVAATLIYYIVYMTQQG